jgi:hypothetical protein
VAAVISISVGRPERDCDPEPRLVVSIHNPGIDALWMRIALDEEGDAFRRFWLHVVAVDGRAVNSRCISSSGLTPYELIKGGATVKFDLGLDCYRQSKPGWYLVTAHYQDAPPPVEPPGPAEPALAASALRGPDAPPGASKVRSRVNSNGQWVFLNAAGSSECKID